MLRRAPYGLSTNLYVSSDYFNGRKKAYRGAKQAEKKWKEDVFCAINVVWKETLTEWINGKLSNSIEGCLTGRVVPVYIWCFKILKDVKWIIIPRCKSATTMLFCIQVMRSINYFTNKWLLEDLLTWIYLNYPQNMLCGCFHAIPREILWSIRVKEEISEWLV